MYVDMGSWIVLVLAAMLVAGSAAATTYRLSEDEAKEKAGANKGVLGLAMDEIEQVEADTGVDLNNLKPESTLFVIGDGLSGPENAALAASETNSPKLFKNTAYASKTTASEVGKTDKLVILIGGPAQNRVTREFFDRGLLKGKRHEFMNQVVIVSGTSEDGAKLIVLSDKRGFENLPRNAAYYSPLALCLPLQLVPVVASLIGAILASLLNLAKTYVEFYIADKGKSGRKMSHKKVVGVRIYAVASVIAASIVIGAAMSWTYAGPTWDFIWLLALNTFIAFLGGISHEVIHLVAGRLLGIETEYRLWLSGSFATVFTAFLGNSFGIQGFLLEEIKEGTPKWKVGVLKMTSPILSAAVMVLFAAVNLFIPHVAFQMVYSIAALWAMAEILPFKPMDGHDVFKWSKLVWAAAFALISVAYIIVSFVL